jgi:flagellar basal-body rod modification protein FlgD
MATPTTPPVTGTFTPTPAVPAKAKQVDIFSSQGFLKILASQMTSQNPLEPMKDTEFIGQMAQFSQLEQTTNMASNMKALAMSSQLAQGASLIGKNVTYLPAGTLTPVTGQVQSLTMSGGTMSLIVGGVSVDPGLVTQVAA